MGGVRAGRAEREGSSNRQVEERRRGALGRGVNGRWKGCLRGVSF